MKLWKRNAVVAAIVLFVCVAVYLNWSYGQEESAVNGAEAVTTSSESTEANKTLGEAALVNSDGSSGAEEVTEDVVLDTWESEESAEAAAVTGQEEETSGGYFATARLNREEARAEALAILQDTVESGDADETAVNAASESITAMANATLAESQIENLVTAKGYSDCVAFIGENSVSVVVSTASGTLEAEDVAKITDIVLGETDVAASAVKVVLAQ